MAAAGPGPGLHPLSIRPLAQATTGILQRHWQLLWPVAAALFFLPQLLISLVVPATRHETPAELSASVPFVIAGLLAIVATLVGQLTIASIAVRDGTDGRTLGEVLMGALRRMVPALAVVAVQGIGTIVGGLLFILPGLWMLARLSVAMPVIATDSDDPLAALRQSWELTRGLVLRILACLAAVLALVLALFLTVSSLGILLGGLRPDTIDQPFHMWSLGRWLFELASAATAAASGLVVTCFYGRLLVVVRALPRGGRA